MAISQDMRAKTTPIGPYLSLSVMTVSGEDDGEDDLHAQPAKGGGEGGREQLPPRDAARQQKPHGEPPEGGQGRHGEDREEHRTARVVHRGPGPAAQDGGTDQEGEPDQPAKRVFQSSSVELEGPLVELLNGAGRGNAAQDEEHPGGPGDGVGGGGRGGEQLAHVGRGLFVESQVPGQRVDRGSPGQGVGDDQKREEAQEQRGCEQQALD